MWNKLFLIIYLLTFTHSRTRAQNQPVKPVARNETGVMAGVLPVPGPDSSLFFKDFLLFNKSVLRGQKIKGRVLLRDPIGIMRLIVLNHNENVFSLVFDAARFKEATMIRYQYMMEGFDNAWTFFDVNSKKVTYTNLDPGRYTFRIRSTGSPVNKAISIQVLIRPSFWRSPVAYLLYVLGIITLLLFIRKRGIEKLIARFNEEIESISILKRQELELMKRKFFTNISHEFYIPLSLILAPVEKLLSSLHSTEIRQELGLIRHNAKQLLRHVNQLMDFRKLETNELVLHKSAGDLVAFIEGLSQAFKEGAGNSSVCLIFDSEVPEFYTSFDHNKIERILFNLLSNAYKFTPGKGRISVLLSLKEKLDSALTIVEIKVSDTGIGISEETIHKIFDPFFQNNLPASIVNLGSGIGLTIIRDFVKIQQGTISVKCEPGTGACFCISIPFERLTEPSMVIEADELKLEILPGYQGVKVANSIFTLKKPLLLIVESNEGLRQYMKAMLENTYSVLEASTGREGWQKALSYNPGLILSDVQVPELNGSDLCMKIKMDLRTSHIKVILLASDPGEVNRLKETGTGADDYISRPFHLVKLRSTIADLLAYGVILEKGGERGSFDPLSEEEVSSDNLFLQKVYLVVENNLSNPKFSMEEFGHEMFISRYLLSKRIVALTGKTPVELVRSMRMIKAARLIENGRHSMTQICTEVGFKNQKYFVKSFKSAFNTLPADFVESTLVP